MNNTKYTFRVLLPAMLTIFLGLVFVFRPEVFSFILNAIKPLIISFTVAYLLDSLVRTLTKRLKIRRTQAILLTCIFVLGLIAIVFAILIPTLIDNANAVISFAMNSGKLDMGDIINNIAAKFNNKYINDVAGNFMEISEEIRLKINDLIRYLYDVLINLVTSIGSSIISIVTSFILAIYMLIEKEDLLARAKRFVRAFFSESKAEMIFETSRNTNKIFKSFLVGKLIDSFIVAVLTVTVFTIFGIPYAPLMGSIIGLFNLIPFFGPIIGAVPVVVVSFIIDPPKAIAALIIIIIIGQIDGNFIDPRIVGNNVGVSPFWVISAVLLGGAVLGPVGMIIGVPTTVLLKTIIEDIVKYKLNEKNMDDFEIENLRETKKSK